MSNLGGGMAEAWAGWPADEQLALETFLPADGATAALLRGLPEDQGALP